MDLDDSNKSEVELLDIANSILALVSSSKKIENEEDLFSDEFYVSIISSLMPDEDFEFEPGKTLEEKAKVLKNLLKYLSNILETDLSKIDAEAIILKHDRENAKDLLELLFSLIQTIIKANLEQMGDEDIELNDEDFKSESFNGNRLNLSEKKVSEMKVDKDEEIDLEKLESLKLGKDKDKGSSKKENEDNEEDKKY